jgi:hypothetical protein
MHQWAVFPILAARRSRAEHSRCRPRSDAAPFGSGTGAPRVRDPEDLRMRRRRLVERFGDDDAGELADNLAREIRDVEKALSEARENDLITRHTDNPTFINRWCIARLKLESGDEEARTEMAVLMKQRVRSVVLTPEKHLIVTFTNNRRNSPTIKVEISTDGQRMTIN